MMVTENMEKDIELKIALVLPKLENFHLLSNAAVDDLSQELNYLVHFLCQLFKRLLVKYYNIMNARWTSHLQHGRS